MLLRGTSYLVSLCRRLSHRVAHRSDRSATSVEYGLVVGVVAVVVIMAATVMRGQWTSVLESVASSFNGA